MRRDELRGKGGGGGHCPFHKKSVLNLLVYRSALYRPYISLCRFQFAKFWPIMTATSILVPLYYKSLHKLPKPLPILCWTIIEPSSSHFITSLLYNSLQEKEVRDEPALGKSRRLKSPNTSHSLSVFTEPLHSIHDEECNTLCHYTFSGGTYHHE